MTLVKKNQYLNYHLRNELKIPLYENLINHRGVEYFRSKKEANVIEKWQVKQNKK